MKVKKHVSLLSHLFLITACFLIAVPFVWIFLNSIKYFRDIVSGDWRFTPTLINYFRLFFERGSEFGRLFLNSVFVGVLVTLICLALGTLAAYSLTRFNWKKWLSAGLMGWILFIHMVPPVTISGAFYFIMQSFGVYDTRFALILAHTVICIPFSIWMIHAIISDLPREIEESALIDGCTRIGSLTRIIIPLSAPALAATAVLTFIFSWNEFLFALTLSSTPRAMTIPVGIANFVQEYSVKYGEMSAAAFFATIPMIVFVALIQKHLITGLTMGALKS